MRLPRGFLASGVRAGIRKDKKRLDLALLVASRGANAAALFTRNRFQAAPVVLGARDLERSGGRVRAVVVNAGCANAITGAPGMDSARRVRDCAAALLGCPKEEVLVSSTGVIGVLLPDAKIRAALPDAKARLSASGLEAASHAILTTDVGPKVAQASFVIAGRRGRVVGVAKGAGMIHPNMATMLAFVMTDAAASPAYLKATLRAAAEESFNAISVDGDTSTNDTLLVMASGEMGGRELRKPGEGAAFRAALTKVCRALAWMMVRDGEGATRVLEISIVGAHNAIEAKAAAHAIATSPLVKTALSGGDPNWGRILAAVGRSGARLSPTRVSLTLGPLTLVKNGLPAKYSESRAERIFSRERVPIVVDLGAGKAKARKLSCDLGHAYVSVNADYRS
ncbi:MAG: bifunctional glutamate N-acetyltransferase/amino-acid acetyltransferase ArgJ [Acidobacteriota bacterium]|nr:bifunctional glutamate N-acetyltransferase/amino-acid acetyltransferase ArgJ [Acidobacteriota bacterium]